MQEEITMIKRKPVRRTVRKTVKRTAKTGRWAILGIHGGTEGKQWTRAKRYVSKASGDLHAAKNGIKATYIGKISKMGQLNAMDKQSLIHQIERM